MNRFCVFFLFSEVFKRLRKGEKGKGGKGMPTHGTSPSEFIVHSS